MDGKKERGNAQRDFKDLYICAVSVCRLEIHEMVLRRQPRTSRCIDVLNVTDHLTPYNSMSRGSFCGELQSLVIISRSNNVTLKLDIGAIGQDMPKKLGFMASYKSTGTLPLHSQVHSFFLVFSSFCYEQSI